MKILVLNAGSSTLKFQLLEVGTSRQMELLAKASFDRIGTSKVSFRISFGDLPHVDVSKIRSVEDAAEATIKALPRDSIDAIGYRVVHGGDDFDGPARVTPDVLEKISNVSELAPLHNAAALRCIHTGLRLLPDLPAVAVFDTSFHRTMPEVARRYAIPRELADRHHLHRFGFHGTSHAYVSGQLQQVMKQAGRNASRLITCHLGNGASLCAVRDGKSVDTSMGLTPLEGLIMGTRSGDVDPGLVLHLMRVLKMSADDVDGLLNQRSGLLGLSERSGDLRDLEQAAANSDARAEATLESFAYRCRKYVGAYAAVLGGIDGIAFTGGIGEHSPGMRSRIARGLEFIGIRLDEQANSVANGKSSVSIGAGDAAVWVIPTDEERQVAEEVFSICS